MITNFYTTPLQGKIFRLVWNMILNINEKYVQNIMCDKKLALKEGHKRGECTTD